MALDLLVNVDFLDEEAIGYLNGLRSVAVEKRAAKIERIGEAMSGIDAHDERSFAMFGKVHSCCRRDARFAYATFSAEEKNPHSHQSETMARRPGLHAFDPRRLSGRPRGIRSFVVAE